MFVLVLAATGGVCEMRWVAAGVVAAVLGLQGCSSLGLGGGSRPPRPDAPRDFRPQGSPLLATLARFDANADQEIAVDEFEAVLKIDYVAADANGDGKLGYSETAALNRTLNGETKVSPIIDWNGNGHVELEEFGAQWRTLFKRADTNDDKVLSQAELMRPMPRDVPPPAGGPPGGKPPGGGPPGGGPPGGKPGGGGF
ncbi:MAG: hypothetical protein SGI91_24175 [Alphaproteobacteria bacterium]|nr:hypothetical protein [Alphaproteobacteria bacterium]